MPGQSVLVFMQSVNSSYFYFFWELFKDALYSDCNRFTNECGEGALLCRWKVF